MIYLLEKEGFGKKSKRICMDEPQTNKQKRSCFQMSKRCSLIFGIQRGGGGGFLEKGQSWLQAIREVMGRLKWVDTPKINTSVT